MGEIKEWLNHKGFSLDSINGFEVIECETCGFKHILPIPTQEELEVVYRQEYYTVEKPQYLERHRQDLDWWNLVYGRRYDTFEKLLPSSRRRILDVGSGPGFFLLHGQHRGWQVMGVEPSAQAVAHSRQLGLEIVEGFLNEQMVKQIGDFDVVHLHQVLEHIPDPAGMLRLTHSLLNPGGLLCVIVANEYNPLQKILRESLNYKPWWVIPPEHINYFCFESIERLIRRTGFSPIHKEATFPMELFLLMGENYVGHDSVGRRMHGMRKTLEFNLTNSSANGLLGELYSALAGCSLGRECVVMATR